MKLNTKVVEMLLRGSSNFELVSQLDMYGNGTIVQVNAVDKLYYVKSNYQGTDTSNIILADNVKKEVNQFIKILNKKGYEKL